jgi:hypothetical protein
LDSVIRSTKYKNILSALNRIELGKGEVFIFTFSLVQILATEGLNSVVANKLLNLIEK